MNAAKRYEPRRLYGMPCGSDTAHGVWDFHISGFIRVDGRTWSSWNAADAVTVAASLNAGKGLPK